jgi:hypothetical protein
MVWGIGYFGRYTINQDLVRLWLRDRHGDEGPVLDVVVSDGFHRGWNLAYITSCRPCADIRGTDCVWRHLVD